MIYVSRENSIILKSPGAISRDIILILTKELKFESLSRFLTAAVLCVPLWMNYLRKSGRDTFTTVDKLKGFKYLSSSFFMKD